MSVVPEIAVEGINGMLAMDAGRRPGIVEAG